MKHAVPNERMKRACLGDIHSATQRFFQLDEQPSREPWRRARTSLDQQIDIALLACVAPRERTEQTDTLNSMLGGDG